ncbi:hypothetical protein R6V09_06740 [Streptomyces sp. W16]|uniref:hypothetical protein n=1 Tax=Streptomyces sp. W16 TaxID=3076631 RepID=UPI00295BDE96|nr:hypothetical protein [Streptomyces sp. W16]MDV9169833.1 hypothetical protein [Streptomyces sp. W16]
MFLDKRETGERMGRPLGALKGRTEQANEFARWLRRITAGVTVRALEEAFPYGKSSWSGFRDGSRLPPVDLVAQVAARFLREPAMRTRQLEHGLGLLAAAEQAAKALQQQQEVVVHPGAALSAVLATQRRLDPVALALLRLDDARLRQIEAMQRFAASERRREELEAMVSVLEQRITILESERDQAREDTRAELQRELRMSLEYRNQADEKLKHARRAEEQARRLRLEAEKQVARERVELLRVDRDTATDTVPQPVVEGSVAEDLQLPPLDRIRELLEVAQEQLDAQDDELDDLGEQLGAQTPYADDDSAATRIVWGQAVDAADPAGDGPKDSLDNPGKPLTGTDGTHAVKEITAGAHPASAPGGLRAPSGELMLGLSTVSTPDALALKLTQLLRRAGVQSIRQLTVALPADMKDDVFRVAVSRWIDGEDLPDTWPHLEALVRLMDATDDEIAAFRQAYDRIVNSDSAAWGSSPVDDLADLTPFTRGLHHIFRASGAVKVRTGERIMAGFAPVVVVALTTAYTAGLQTSPGPGPVKLAGYGTVLLTACAATLLVAARVSVLCARPEKPLLQRRFTAASLTASVLAVPAGLALPWLLDSDTPGRWFAHVIGLL